MRRNFPRWVRVTTLTALLAMSGALGAEAQDWGKVANISNTMGVNGGRLCSGEASRGDIGCPTYAPSLTTAGDVSVTGNLSATKFIGDGSLLTGIAGGAGASTFASLTDVSVSSALGNLYGPTSISGMTGGIALSTAFGIQALSSGNGGYSNSAFGAGALGSTTSGYENTGVGVYSLVSNTTGHNNTALGGYALGKNTTGSDNLAVGSTVLNNSISASRNVGLGAYALALATGSSNTVVGYNAAAGVTSGASNIVIGASTSPYSNTGSWQLNIGNAVWGDIGSGLGGASNKIGINVTSPTAALEAVLQATTAK
jgi:hypothetical protein